MKRRTFLKALFLYSGGFWVGAPEIFAASPDINSIKILMIYNNIGSSNNLVDDWGLSLWVEDKDTAVLFDTGGDPAILLKNIETSGVDLQKLSSVVISHNHWDHINGLPAILEKSARKPAIYVPKAALDEIQKMSPETKLIEVDKPIQITQHIWSTGQLKGRFRGEPIYEQSIAISQNTYSFLFTGCSHPGIIRIVERTKKIFLNNNLKLVGGGFHLMNRSREDINAISTKLHQLEVSNLAPSHCTGNIATNIFKKDWGKHFIDLNNGDKMIA